MFLSIVERFPLLKCNLLFMYQLSRISMRPAPFILHLGKRMASFSGVAFCKCAPLTAVLCPVDDGATRLQLWHPKRIWIASNPLQGGRGNAGGLSSEFNGTHWMNYAVVCGVGLVIKCFRANPPLCRGIHSVSDSLSFLPQYGCPSHCIVTFLQL